MRRSRIKPDYSWPSWRYGANGESGIFQCEADVPYGWTKKPGEIYVPPMANHLDRDTLITLLNDKGIIAKGHWSAAYMKELLEQ